ncbi:HAD family hydrolase [Alteromonas sp. H39]|uniref:HAD family hydrolase n=1 Tax=Alteromonas sp. H39 TaxID=3389876 RepID=UPI0039E122E8
MTIYDSILERAIQLPARVVTFDIFDTVVFRHLPHPAWVFANVALSGVSELTGVTPADYRLLREQAERLARKQASASEDIPFEAIFNAMPLSAQSQLALRNAELTAEKACATINHDMVNVIRRLVDEGVQVAFISDMYLSAAQIKETFFGDSELLQSLPIYVSCEQHVAKFSGKLFRKLADENGWQPSEWLHIGDNKDADVKAAEAVGLHTQYFNTLLNNHWITSLEEKQFDAGKTSHAVRLLASMQNSQQGSQERVAYEMGSYVWGPVIEAFARWAVSQSEQSGCKQILCLMREGFLFTPVIQKVLSLMGRSDIHVSSFYVSRKSAFWPGIDTSAPHWLEQVMDTLMTYRGYTLRNFIDDFQTSESLAEQLDDGIELKNIEGVFIDGEPLYQRLCREAKANESGLRDKIAQQRNLLSQYFSQVSDAGFENCAVVDFGNGGTIQHCLENIFGSVAGANLLFYSSLRAYRFVDKTLYRAFLSPANTRFRLTERLARSPECLEALLLGSGGTTLEYQCQEEQVSPVLAAGIKANAPLCDAFLAGCLSYLDTAHQLSQPPVEHSTAAAIVARYVLMPTEEEAGLFQHLLHQDNFGTDGEYPVIDEGQINMVASIGLEATLASSTSSNRWKLGELHWPAGVVALQEQAFLARSQGLMENDNIASIEELMKKLLALRWTRIAVYGAGEFFIQLLPYLRQHNIDVTYLIDRKAEVSPGYSVAGIGVVTLEKALNEGADQFVISSRAFRDEIAERITQAAEQQGITHLQLVGA